MADIKQFPVRWPADLVAAVDQRRGPGVSRSRWLQDLVERELGRRAPRQPAEVQGVSPARHLVRDSASARAGVTPIPRGGGQ